MSKWTGYITASGVWFTLANVKEVNDWIDVAGQVSALLIGAAFMLAALIAGISKEGRDG